MIIIEKSSRGIRKYKVSEDQTKVYALSNGGK